MSVDPAFEAVVDRVAELLRLRIGLRPDSSLRGRLRRSVRDEATAHGKDPGAYVDTLIARETEVQGLFNQVTVQETSFFRHPEQFQIVARDILPRLARPVTIWSAGCANGQEAFSLAMLLEELNVDGTVIASDVSTSALGRTAAAQYSLRELTGLSPGRVARHLTPIKGGWLINENLRNRVTTLRHNLIDEIPEQVRPSQLVFCRNVLIYFSADHARTFLDRVAEAMPAAEVFLGAAETMWSVSDRYETVRADNTFYHRQRATRRTVPQPHNDDPKAVLKHRNADAAARRAAGHPNNPNPAITHAVRTGPNANGTSVTRLIPGLPPPRNDHVDAVALTKTGQQAFADGDHRSAIVAFRKCVYLTPDDALAYLHLGLALEADGDIQSARRAFAMARRTVLETASTKDHDALGGYATTELIRLLDAKQVTAP